MHFDRCIIYNYAEDLSKINAVLSSACIANKNCINNYTFLNNNRAFKHEKKTRVLMIMRL